MLWTGLEDRPLPGAVFGVVGRSCCGIVDRERLPGCRCFSPTCDDILAYRYGESAATRRPRGPQRRRETPRVAGLPGTAGAALAGEAENVLPVPPRRAYYCWPMPFQGRVHRDVRCPSSYCDREGNDAGFYMSEKFGAWQVGDDHEKGPSGSSSFSRPGQVAVAIRSRSGQPTYGDPQVSGVRVVGDFMSALGLTDWDWANGLVMARTNHAKGTVWAYQIPVELPQDFYQYKYFVTFKDGSARKVPDPCTRYGGPEDQNSGFVIGGSSSADNVGSPVAGGRKHLRDLVVYELNIDDFTEQYRGLESRRKLSGIGSITCKINWASTPSSSCPGPPGRAPGIAGATILFRTSRSSTATSQNWRAGRETIGAQGPDQRLSRARHPRDPRRRLQPRGRRGPGRRRRGLRVPLLLALPEHRRLPIRRRFAGGFGPGLPDRDYHNGCVQEFVRDVCY